MSGLEIALLVAAGVVAAANWWAVADGGSRRAIAVTKLGATTILIALAAVAGSMDATTRGFLVAAVVLGLVGDAALLGDSTNRFLAGLSAFALGHLAYVVAALLVGVSWLRALGAIPFLVVLLGFRFLSRTVPGAAAAGGAVMRTAVVGYAAIISAMVVTATGTPNPLAALGAMSFAVSDWMIGHGRFVGPIRHERVAIMVTYHLGQALLILGLAHA